MITQEKILVNKLYHLEIPTTITNTSKVLDTSYEEQWKQRALELIKAYKNDNLITLPNE